MPSSKHRQKLLYHAMHGKKNKEEENLLLPAINGQ